MAKNNLKVLLGYEDELITDKYKGQVNFTTNKIGGKPDLPKNVNLDFTNCPLCKLPRPLVVQIYAPLDHVPHHRTLYLFACVNPNCWTCSESWLCIRIHSKETLTDVEETNEASTKFVVTDWCADADDWGDDNEGNLNEQNGNVVNNNEKMSDEDEESCSLDESIRSMGNLSVDDRNANVGAQGGAVGRLHSPAASAEIEGNEGEVISIDTPTIPQCDITAILQEVPPLPQDICQNTAKNPQLQFVPYFMAVWEETTSSPVGITDNHVKELLQEYQKNNEESTNLNSPDTGGASGGGNGEMACEKYEKSQPAHGDKMFYHFLTKLQSNPGQILRYSRGMDGPLLLCPLQDSPKKCQYCQSELMFEFQLVPTIISKLRLVSDAKNCSRLEFGTILVFTCRKSCWDSETPRIETVILQSEV